MEIRLGNFGTDELPADFEREYDQNLGGLLLRRNLKKKWQSLSFVRLTDQPLPFKAGDFTYQKKMS